MCKVSHSLEASSPVAASQNSTLSNSPREHRSVTGAQRCEFPSKTPPSPNMEPSWSPSNPATFSPPFLPPDIPPTSACFQALSSLCLTDFAEIYPVDDNPAVATPSLQMGFGSDFPITFDPANYIEPSLSGYNAENTWLVPQLRWASGYNDFGPQIQDTPGWRPWV